MDIYKIEICDGHCEFEKEYTELSGLLGRACSRMLVLNDKVALIKTKSNNLYGLFDLTKMKPITNTVYDHIDIDFSFEGVTFAHLFKGVNYWTVDVRKDELKPKLNPHICEKQLSILERKPMLYDTLKDAYLNDESQRSKLEQAALRHKDFALEHGDDLHYVSRRMNIIKSVIENRNGRILPNNEELFVCENNIATK